MSRQVCKEIIDHGAALMAALTLGPVLLHWLRGVVFWPFAAPHHERGRDPENEGLEQPGVRAIGAQFTGASGDTQLEAGREAIAGDAR